MRTGSRQRVVSDYLFGLDPLSCTPPVLLLSAPRRVPRSGGDMEGRAVWLRIGKAIEELLSKERPDDTMVN